MENLKGLTIAELEVIVRDDSRDKRERDEALVFWSIKTTQEKLTDEKKEELLDRTIVVNKDTLTKIVSDTNRMISDLLRFVRQGEKIIMFKGVKHMHAEYSVANNLLEPDDAGHLYVPMTIENTIQIDEGSSSLGILEDNPNRQDTINILEKIAPEIQFLTQI
jgi:hypothetical protein